MVASGSKKPSGVEVGQRMANFNYTTQNLKLYNYSVTVFEKKKCLVLILGNSPVGDNLSD